MENLITKANAFLSRFVIDCRIPADKQMHFICGCVIAAAAALLIGAYAVVLVAVIALLKEIYDHANKSLHTSDAWDWVATALGGVIGFYIIYLLKP